MPTAPSPQSPGKKPSQAAAPAPITAATTTELGLTERRRLVRPLPAPHAVESEGDSDWAMFQALLADKQKT